MHLTTHTLIVGGGPSGATLARELSKNKIENILIEKNLNFDKPCGGGIKAHVYDEFDLPKDLETKRINSINLYSQKLKSQVDISKSPLTIVLRKEFDARLRDLAQKDGSQIIEAKFMNAKYYKDYVVSQIKTQEGIISIKSKYLVAADGVRSKVKKDFLNTYPNSILTNYSLLEDSDFDICEFYFGKNISPNQYAWIFPHGKELSIGSVLDNEEAKKFFEKLKFEKEPNKKIKTKGYYIPGWQDKTIFNKNNVFFVGDAASQVLPFTYEGIYYAMSSARILAQAIIEEKPELYEKLWNESFQRRFKFFQIMQKIFLSNDYLTNKMIKFFSNEKLKDSAMSYWRGDKKPLGFISSLSKLFKVLIKAR